VLAVHLYDRRGAHHQNIPAFIEHQLNLSLRISRRGRLGSDDGKVNGNGLSRSLRPVVRLQSKLLWRCNNTPVNSIVTLNIYFKANRKGIPIVGVRDKCGI
jgi:hypothetical protein